MSFYIYQTLASSIAFSVHSLRLFHKERPQERLYHLVVKVTGQRTGQYWWQWCSVRLLCRLCRECRKSRSLVLVNVPAAWGSVRGLRLGNLTSDPTESETACKGGWRGLQGQRKVEGEGDGGLCHLQYNMSSRIPSRSAGLLFFCLIPRPLGSLAGKRLLKYTSVLVSAHTSSPLTACRR